MNPKRLLKNNDSNPIMIENNEIIIPKSATYDPL
jgi:hypothetical protein